MRDILIGAVIVVVGYFAVKRFGGALASAVGGAAPVKDTSTVTQGNGGSSPVPIVQPSTTTVRTTSGGAVHYTENVVGTPQGGRDPGMSAPVPSVSTSVLRQPTARELASPTARY